MDAESKKIYQERVNFLAAGPAMAFLLGGITDGLIAWGLGTKIVTSFAARVFASAEVVAAKGVQLTKHGAERIAGAAATRGGVLSIEEVGAIRSLVKNRLFKVMVRMFLCMKFHLGDTVDL